MENINPLLDRLEAYAPDVITIEDSSRMTCNRIRAYPLEYVGIADSHCFDGAPFREESGLSISEGTYQARIAILG
ncbi:MAG: hypothetical protein ABJ275_06675 [Maricaulaceae bacterium]